MSRLELDQDATCPFCGGALERGYVSSRVGRIRWIPENARWVRFLGGASLATNWFIPPLLEAARCPPCGLGLFGYDTDTYG